MSDLIEIERAIKELPELYGKISHEAEVKRAEFERAEQELAFKEAGDTLKLQATRIDGESVANQTSRIKNQVIVDLHKDTLEVLTKKADYRRLELDADIISKKIMLLCKSVDIFQTSMYQEGRIDKATKPMFNNTNATGVRSKMGEM